MSEIKTGGPAFPLPSNPDQIFEGHQGMTLRDYFAASAMIGFVSKAYPHVDNIKRETIAQYSYEQADAMIKARES